MSMNMFLLLLNVEEHIIPASVLSVIWNRTASPPREMGYTLYLPVLIIVWLEVYSPNGFLSQIQ